MNNSFSQRGIVIITIFVIIALTYIVKLYFIQISDNQYSVSAENNSTRIEVQYPARGLIYDRNHELLVANAPAYDLMVVPRQLEAFDTTELCNIANISRKKLRDRIYEAKIYSYYKPSVIIKHLSARTYATLQEKLYKYPGFFARTRTQRRYLQEIAPHLLGYISEVNENTADTSYYYKPGDYIGKTGIEKSYEKYLRGVKGQKVFLVDVHGRKQGSYKDGKFDSVAVSGHNITATIDADLQSYGEKLMENKKGSIVAIEPETGEILSLVNSLDYKASKLVGRQRGEAFSQLQNDTLNPLFNRALMAEYPPGSTFKPMNALVGLEEGVITPTSGYTCRYGYHVGNFTVKCHHDRRFELEGAIQFSCNAYFSYLFRQIIDDPNYEDIHESYANWRSYVQSTGLGKKLTTDLNEQLKGNIPRAEYFDQQYGKGRWNSLMIVSMGIGQGELGFTPLQMANYATTIANRGYYYPPHVVKDIEGDAEIPSKLTKRHDINIDTTHYITVIEGMEKVVEGGTATTAQVKNITVCGKTGTAQNPHGEDHSIFIAFAPKNDPEIAMAVYVENAGYGSVWAAPIASLMIEKYLKDKITKKYWERRILEANLLNPQKPDKTN